MLFAFNPFGRFWLNIFKNINGYDKSSIIKRVVVIIKNIKNFKFIKQISNLLELRKEIKKVCKNIPENYDINKVNIWKDKYNLLFKDILKWLNIR